MELNVYLHTDVDVRTLNSQLSQELPGWKVTVFGRHRDFETAVKAGGAALALKPVLQALGLTVGVQGTRDGGDSERRITGRKCEHTAELKFGGVGISSAGERQVVHWWRYSAMPIRPKNGGQVEAAMCGRPAEGNVWQDNRHGVRVSISHENHDVVVEGSDNSRFGRIEQRGVADVNVIFFTFDDECHCQRREQRDVDEPQHGCGLGRGAMTEDGVHRGIIGVESIPMSGVP